MKKRNFLISLITLLLVGCLLAEGGLVYWGLSNPKIRASLNQFASMFGDMAQLQEEITTAYPADAVKVGITGSSLKITLVNSTANSLPEVEQDARAKEVALFAKNHYAQINNIDTILIILVQQNGAFGFSINFTRNYVYKLSDLP